MSNYFKSLAQSLREQDAPIPGDSPPGKQLHVFDFDDTLGVTKNSTGVMLYVDGAAAHKSRWEVQDWLASVGINRKDLGDEGVVSVPERGGYVAHLTSRGVAKLHDVYPGDTQTTTDANKVRPSGETVVIDYTPSSGTDVETTEPIRSTIQKLRTVDAEGSKTVVITARKSSGSSKDIRGREVTASNASDISKFLAKQGVSPSDGVVGVSGGNKGSVIVNRYIDSDDPPEEVHFYDDAEKNTSEVEAAVARKTPAELFVYGPGSFVDGEVDPYRPTKAFPASKLSVKRQKECINLDRWRLMSGVSYG